MTRMAREKYKFRMYQELARSARTILEKASALAEKSPEDAARPSHAPESPPRRMPPEGEAGDVLELVEKIRGIVKDAYGEAYDACPVSSTGSGLALLRAAAIPCFGAAESEGLPGEDRWAVVLRQKPSEMVAGLRPLPPKYALLPEFTAAINQNAKTHPRAFVVPLAGATYSYHGIIPAPVAMLAGAHTEPTLDAVAAAAEACLPHLSAIIAMGTGIPGCGFSPVDENGLPELHAGLGEIASEYDVPLLLDSSTAIPFLGPDLSKLKVAGAVFGPFGKGGPGIIIGTEELVVPLLEMSPGSGSHGRGHSVPGYGLEPHLPGPHFLVETLELVRSALEDPELFKKAVDKLYDIAVEELSPLKDEFKQPLLFRKSYETLSIEVNYEDTWDDGIGFPVFSFRDIRHGTHLIREGLKSMGAMNISVLDASIVLQIPRKTLAQAQNPQADLETLRQDLRSLVALLKIIGEEIGYPV